MVFKVGEKYESYAREYDPIKIVRRTDKTIWVDNGRSKWRMRIRKDDDGNEYAIDSSVPQRWRDAFTYKAEFIIDGKGR